jgi:hypothetical protein
MCNWCTFGAQIRHEQTQVHKTHHNSNLGKATTSFPFIIFFMPSHGAYIQMSFCPGTPEIFEIETLVTLKAHNFLPKPSIEVRFEQKL